MAVEKFCEGVITMPRPRTKRTPRSPKENFVLGTRLKEIRKRRGLSQMDLGEKLGLSQRAISNYESGRNRLSAILLLKVASVLRASTSELLGQKQTNGSDKDKKVWKFVNQVEALPPKDKRAVTRFVEALSTNTNGQRAA